MRIILIILTLLNIMVHPLFSDKQADFYNSGLRDFNIMSGVTASGKSFSANLKFYDEICRKLPKGSTALISGSTAETIYDNVIRPLQEIDNGFNMLRYVGLVGGKRLLVPHRDIEIPCIGANNEKSQNRIQGKPSVKLWYADEIVKQPKSFVDMCISRLRGVENGKMRTYPCIWTCNPDGPSHYIKQEYIDNIKIDVKNWYFGFKDNPTCTDEFIEKQKVQYSGVFLERMIYGRWVMAEGCIYDKFDRDKHIVDNYPVSQVKEYVLGIDWGYAKDHPLAILLVAVTDQAHYVIDEIYAEQQLINQSLVDMMKIKGWYNLKMNKPDKEVHFIVKQSDDYMPSYAYCDSARPDLMTQFNQFSGIQVIPAIKDVDDGIQTVQRTFVKKGDDSYGTYFLKGCVNTIREHELFRWDQTLSGAGKNVPKKIDDHCPDAYRYILHTRSRGVAKELQDYRMKTV